MGSKVFLKDENGYAIVSDSRDILLPARLRDAVWDWCSDQNIDLEGIMYGIMKHDIWRVRDQSDRALFLLRWSNAECD